MRTREVTSAKQRLDRLFQLGTGAFPDLELQAHWARYLCVLACGLLETAVRFTYAKYAESRAHPAVASYVGRQVGSFQNPKIGRIIAVARHFNDDWADELEQRTEGKLADHVNSLVGLRHAIAHGNNASSATYATIREYYESVVEVIEIIERQCS